MAKNTKKKSNTGVFVEIEKAPDLLTHVRTVNVDGVEVVELRDFIPSLGDYGRGYWIPKDVEKIHEIIDALEEIAND